MVTTSTDVEPSMPAPLPTRNKRVEEVEIEPSITSHSLYMLNRFMLSPTKDPPCMSADLGKPGMLSWALQSPARQRMQREACGIAKYVVTLWCDRYHE